MEWVCRVEHQRRAGLQHPPHGVRVDERVLAQLVDDQVVAALRRRVGVGGDVGDARVVHHGRRQIGPLVQLPDLVPQTRRPDLLDLDRPDVAILGQPGRERPEGAPPVGAVGPDADHGRGDDEVGLAHRPRGAVRPVDRRRHVGRIAPRRAGIDPLGDQRDLLPAERDVVLEALDADVLLDEPGRHALGIVVGARGLVLDGPRPGPHVLVGRQGHRRAALGPVAGLARPLQDRRHVLRERRLPVGLARLRRQPPPPAGRPLTRVAPTNAPPRAMSALSSAHLS